MSAMNQYAGTVVVRTSTGGALHIRKWVSTTDTTARTADRGDKVDSQSSEKKKGRT